MAHDEGATGSRARLRQTGDGRTYAIGRVATRDPDIDDLTEHIGGFIVSIWTSVLDMPLSAREPLEDGSEPLQLRVTVPLPGHRWVRVACGGELGRMIGAHVFDQAMASVDFASSRMAVLELASAIARHAGVIEHPAWPWVSSSKQPMDVADRRTACELWFECRGLPLAVALLYRLDPRDTD
jgi:hypothetical protein